MVIIDLGSGWGWKVSNWWMSLRSCWVWFFCVLRSVSAVSRGLWKLFLIMWGVRCSRVLLWFEVIFSFIMLKLSSLTWVMRWVSW